MFPEGFQERISFQKYIDSESLIKALGEPAPVSIRINSAKWDVSPLNSEAVMWSRSGFYLPARPSFTLDPLFHSGCYYPQEASSMFLEEALRQSAVSTDNINVLDLCGAPGGKSILLSDFIGPGSLLVANEVIRSRALILAENITKWGRSNALVTQNDPSQFGLLTGLFDIILVDAPCSGEGMFRDDVARNEWSLENASHCSMRQKRIIADVWPSLKENGILIYSTCTFNPGENEENIKWLIDSHNAECIRLDIQKFEGIEEIDYNGIYGYGFYPGKIKGDGLFISVIRKKEDQDDYKFKNKRTHSFKPGKADISIATEWGRFTPEKLLKWGDELLALPCHYEDYVSLFQVLKIVKPGTRIFTVKNNDYLPSHDLALSDRIRQDVFQVVDLEYDEAIAYLRRDNIILKEAPKGWIMIRYRGINLGFIKNLGNRVNNYFPVEWRIRMDMPENDQINIITWEDPFL